jgi:hypothetical protein
MRYAKNAVLPTRGLPDMSTKDMKVRARSEAKKKNIIHKEIQQYQMRSELMNNRRNMFFQDSVK